MFHIEDDKAELGLGIHGEAGIQRIDMAKSEELIKKMIDRLTDDDSSCSIRLPGGSQVALIVNNLGGLSVLEMYIAAREAIKELGPFLYT